jgi:S-adenosyl methyltransferase
VTRSSAQSMKSLSPRLDTSVAHAARVWNYLLGGKDNFAADRDVGDMVLQMFPDAAVIARLQRRFLVRVVRFLAGEVGIRQFLDIGTGLPTADNTHEVAQEIAPRSKVVYVDNDPLVLRHAQALLTSAPGGVTSYIEADVRDPEQILQEAARTLDLGEPVAVMMLGILGQIPDCECACEDPGMIVAKLLEALPPGSYLALCDGTDTNAELAKAVATYNEYAAYPYHLRGPARIASFFEGLTLVPPGLVTTSRWRPYVTDATGEPREVDALCGVGRKGLRGPQGLVASRRGLRVHGGAAVVRAGDCAGHQRRHYSRAGLGALAGMEGPKGDGAGRALVAGALTTCILMIVRRSAAKGQPPAYLQETHPG